MKKYPCTHLEKLLPQPQMEPERVYTDVDKFTQNDKFAYHLGVAPEDVDKFIRGLRRMDMPQHEIQVMVDKFVHHHTWKEIVEKRGFTGVDVAYRIYRMALKRAEEALKANLDSGA